MKKNAKALITAASVAGTAYAAVGSAFTFLALTPRGTKLLNSGEPLYPEIDEIYRNSVENAEGGKWFDKNAQDTIFAFNKAGDCLYANFAPSEKPSDVYVITCHGFTSKPRDMGFYGRRFHDMGFNVVFPCMRGHDLSEHNYISMGWHDRLDIVAWCETLAERNPQAKIILHGVSMGGAAVMMTTGEKLPSNVICAIEDCGYTSVWDEYSDQIKKVFHLPPFPFLNAAQSAAKFWLGFSFKEASSVEQLKKSITPTLFIHGDKDNFVPTEMLEPNYEAAACEKEKLLVPGAYHGVSALVEPEIYWSKVTEFIGKYI